jgi:hypothetical protein|nr:MAG: hypothetical protein J07AB56_12300 [Candidatus Nanosalinarum sp. J07AB56]
MSQEEPGELHYAFFDETGPLYNGVMSARKSSVCERAVDSDFIHTALEGNGVAEYNELAGHRSEILSGQEYEDSDLPPLLQTRHALLPNLMNVTSVDGMPQRMEKYCDTDSKPDYLGDSIDTKELFDNVNVAVAESSDRLYDILEEQTSVN